MSSKVSRLHNLLILTLACFSFVDELIQEVERERTAKIEAERKLKGKLYKKTENVYRIYTVLGLIRLPSKRFCLLHRLWAYFLLD